MPGEQATLDRLGIQIRIEQFETGTFGSRSRFPARITPLPQTPQGIIAILKAPVIGTYEAIDVILFVLVIGGFIGVFQTSEPRRKYK